MGGHVASLDVFLGGRTLADALAGLHAKCTGIRVKLGVKVWDVVDDGG